MWCLSQGARTSEEIFICPYFYSGKQQGPFSLEGVSGVYDIALGLVFHMSRRLYHEPSLGTYILPLRLLSSTFRSQWVWWNFSAPNSFQSFQGEETSLSILCILCDRRTVVLLKFWWQASNVFGLKNLCKVVKSHFFALFRNLTCAFEIC